MSVVQIVEVGKRPEEIKDWGFDWSDETFRYYELGAEFSPGVNVRPTVPNGFQYSSSGGQSNGKKEPTWPIVLGETVEDGSIIWTCVALSTAGLNRYISTSEWLPEDATIVVADSSATNSAGTQRTFVKISDGDDETTRDVVNRVTFNDGVILDKILRITIQDEAD